MMYQPEVNGFPKDLGLDQAYANIIMHLIYKFFSEIV